LVIFAVVSEEEGRAN